MFTTRTQSLHRRSGAPGRPSPLRRSSNWSGALTRSSMCRAPNEPIWRKPWNSQRRRWKSGSRTAGIKPSDCRRKRGSGFRRGPRCGCWWGMTKRANRRPECASQWHCQCTTTPACTTGASLAAWTWWCAERCSGGYLKDSLWKTRFTNCGCTDSYFNVMVH